MTEKEIFELIIILGVGLPVITIIWFILLKVDEDRCVCYNESDDQVKIVTNGVRCKCIVGNLEGPKVMTNRFGEICVTSITIETPCPFCGSTRSTLLQHSSNASYLGPNYKLKYNVCRTEFRKTVKEVDEYIKNKGNT